jgi:hypothetical protein
MTEKIKERNKEELQRLIEDLSVSFGLDTAVTLLVELYYAIDEPARTLLAAYTDAIRKALYSQRVKKNALSLCEEEQASLVEKLAEAEERIEQYNEYVHGFNQRLTAERALVEEREAEMVELIEEKEAEILKLKKQRTTFVTHDAGSKFQFDFLRDRIRLLVREKDVMAAELRTALARINELQQEDIYTDFTQ